MYKAKIIVLWYDGYETASGTKLYNPRSVIGALTYNQLRSYWATKAGDTRTMTEPKTGRMKKLSFFHTPRFIFCLYARIGFNPSAN